jgi:hypothetical protein
MKTTHKFFALLIALVMGFQVTVKADEGMWIPRPA